MDERQRHHDMGGQPAGSVDQSSHNKAAWEKRVDALMRLLSHPDRSVLTVDELRRCIEALGPDAYERYSYYERWMSSITEVLLEKNVVTASELGDRMAQVEKRQQEARQ